MFAAYAQDAPQQEEEKRGAGERGTPAKSSIGQQEQPQEDDWPGTLETRRHATSSDDNARKRPKLQPVSGSKEAQDEREGEQLRSGMRVFEEGSSIEGRHRAHAKKRAKDRKKEKKEKKEKKKKRKKKDKEEDDSYDRHHEHGRYKLTIPAKERSRLQHTVSKEHPSSNNAALLEAESHAKSTFAQQPMHTRQDFFGHSSIPEGAQHNSLPPFPTRRGGKLLLQAGSKDPTNVGIFIDVKGDSDNITYMSNYAKDVPQFRRYWRGSVLGSHQRLWIEDGCTLGKKKQARRPRRIHDSRFAARLLSAQEKVEYIPSPLQVAGSGKGHGLPVPKSHVEVAPLELFIPFADLSSANTTTLRGSVPAATEATTRGERGHNRPQDGSANLVGARAGETKEEYVKRRVKEFNVEIRKDPENVHNWESYIDFQDEVFQVDEKMNRKAVALLVERKMALAEQALRECPNSSRLLIGFMDLCAQKESTDSMTERWRRMLGRNSQNINLWLHFLEYSESKIATFTHARAQVEYHECIEHLNELFNSSAVYRQRDAIQDKQAEDMALLEISTRLCTMHAKAGYHERAVCLFQALVEFNVTLPPHYHKKGRALSALEEFWEANVPRIGDPDAKGIDYFHLMKKAGHAVRPYQSESHPPPLPGQLTVATTRGAPPPTDHNIIAKDPNAQDIAPSEEPHRSAPCMKGAETSSQRPRIEGKDGHLPSANDGKGAAPSTGTMRGQRSCAGFYSAVSDWQQWTALEEYRDDVQWLPWRPCQGENDDDCDDPDRIVLFDDVVGGMFALGSTYTKAMAILHFARFLGAPVRAYASSSASSSIFSFQSLAHVEDTFTPLVQRLEALRRSRGGMVSPDGGPSSFSQESSPHSARVSGIPLGGDIDVWGSLLAAHTGEDSHSRELISLGRLGWCVPRKVLSKEKQSFIRNVFAQALDHLEEAPRAYLPHDGLPDARFHARLPLLTILHLEYISFLETVQPKAARAEFKALLKKPENRNKLPLFIEYARLEERIGKKNASFKVYAAALQKLQASTAEQGVVTYVVHALCTHYLKSRKPDFAEALLVAYYLEQVVSFNVSKPSPVTPIQLAKALPVWSNAVKSLWTKCHGGNGDPLREGALAVMFGALLTSTASLEEHRISETIDRVLASFEDKATKAYHTLTHEMAYLHIASILEAVSSLDRDRSLYIPPNLMYSVLVRALDHFPHNPELMAAYVLHQGSGSMMGQTRVFFHKLIARLPSKAADDPPVVPYLFAIVAELLGKSPSVPRLRSLLVEATKTKAKGCVLLWRWYLALISANMGFDGFKLTEDIFYQAVQVNPGAKQLYLDAVRLLPKSLQEAVDLVMEKELHLRAPLEELAILNERHGVHEE